MKRPPERISRSNAERAVTQGLRTNASAIEVPRPIREVLEAAAASGRNGSWNISDVQSASNPAPSARLASRAMSAAGAIPAAIEKRLIQVWATRGRGWKQLVVGAATAKVEWKQIVLFGRFRADHTHLGQIPGAKGMVKVLTCELSGQQKREVSPCKHVGHHLCFRPVNYHLVKHDVLRIEWPVVNGLDIAVRLTDSTK